MTTPAKSAGDSSDIALAAAYASVRSFSAEASTRRSIKTLLEEDPWAVAALGSQWYAREVHGYTGVFQKRERIQGKLRDLEEMEIRFKHDPKTVYLLWQRNADQAKRVLYIDSDEWVNDEGRKLCRVEPAGALIRLIVSEVTLPIDDKRSTKTSRRSIDDFGFQATFDLLAKFNDLAEREGVLESYYAGESTIDGRPTYVVVRYLPYTGEGGTYPDAKLVMHFDQEWLLPVGVFSYADREGRELLGSYVFTDLKINPKFGKDAFKF